MVRSKGPTMDSPCDQTLTPSIASGTANSAAIAGRFAPLIDSFGRVHESLRVSVTDACNIRCRYCMPESVKGFLPQHHLLSFEEIARVVSVLARAGIRKVRLTGGEPLMRPGLENLVAMLSGIASLEQIAMTTNAMMLADKVEDLVQSGLTHINISLDTLREPAFQEISRREGLDQVLAGIDAAMQTRLKIRLNALLLRNINLEDCLSLVEFARQRDLCIRFIEFMPLDADRQWSQDQVVNGHEARSIIEGRFGKLVPIGRSDPAQPSSDWTFSDGRGGVGFIDPVSQPFCHACNRLRLTADGKMRNCLFGREEWDVKSVCRNKGSDEQIYEITAKCILQKFAAHGISSSTFQQPERAMYQIGG